MYIKVHISLKLHDAALSILPVLKNCFRIFYSNFVIVILSYFQCLRQFLIDLIDFGAHIPFPVWILILIPFIFHWYICWSSFLRSNNNKTLLIWKCFTVFIRE